MFVPLGILLSLIHKKFQNIIFTLCAGLTLTLLIEILQLVTAYGIFELDDIFNNILGTLVGYSMMMTVINLNNRQRHKYRKALAYFSPSLIVVALFVGIFAYYNLKEFGNLSENYDYKLNMKNTTITSDLVLGAEEKIVPIYKAPSLNKDLALEFAVNFFENINIDASNIEIIDYYEETVYSIRGNNGSDLYNIWLNNLDGSFSYTDYSIFDDDMDSKNTSENVIKEKLKNFNINIPDNSIFKSDEDGNYEFVVNNIVDANTLTCGVLSCSYYDDDVIKSIDNNIVVYEKIKDLTVISEMEAYEKITEGKFAYGIYADKIDNIKINGISLDYRLDSKGYYQPVYIFNSLINDSPYSIEIPAL